MPVNISGTGTYDATQNYTGELYLVGKGATPFLNAIGGLQGGNVSVVNTLEFSVGSPTSLEPASQPAISEADSTTTPTATTYTKGQVTNTVQIWQKAVDLTWLAQSRGTTSVSALPPLTEPASGVNMNTDPLDFQISMTLKQLALDLDYTFLNGTFQRAVNSTTPAKTRGMIEAASVNAVDATDEYLQKDHIDAMIEQMVQNGAVKENLVMVANTAQLRKLTKLYESQPDSYDVGGVALQRILTDMASFGIMLDTNMPQDTLLLAEMAVIRPVFLPVPGKGLLYYTETGVKGAATSGFIYGQIGLDYGAPEYHGKIFGLKSA